MTALSAEARTALEGATLTGDLLVLGCAQLDRKVYEEVNRVLTRLGGKWNRKAGGHVFTRPAAGPLAEALGTGVVPADRDKVMSYWPTPATVAEELLYQMGEPWMVDGSGLRVLEPSAGEGHLAVSTRIRFPAAHLVCVEPDPARVVALRRTGVADQIHETTLEQYAAAPDRGLPFDLVVMNPPFTLPGRRAAWAEHIMLLFDTPGLLQPLTVVAAIVPDNGAMTQHRPAGDKPVRRVRELLDAAGRFEALDPRSFRQVGTGVQTGMLFLSVPQ